MVSILVVLATATYLEKLLTATDSQDDFNCEFQQKSARTQA